MTVELKNIIVHSIWGKEWVLQVLRGKEYYASFFISSLLRVALVSSPSHHLKAEVDSRA